MLLLFFIWKKISSKNEDQVQTDAYIIMNQIRKMNKMVVLEQDISTLTKHTFNYDLIGRDYLPAKNLTRNKVTVGVFTKTNAQISYDLNKMKIEVDSTRKKLIIKQLPNPDIKIIPSIEIQSLDDSFFNRISEEDIKSVTKNAKEIAYKTVDQTKLKAEGKKQLMQNLDQIMVLAKALNYKIEDQTNTFDQSKL